MRILKKIFLWGGLIWAVALLLACFVRPKVEAYGQTTLQFDKAENTYFIETEGHRIVAQHLSGVEGMPAGTSVTFYKTRGCVMRVYSGFVAEDDLKAGSLVDMRIGCVLGAVVCSLIVFLGIIDEHRRSV